MDEIKVGSVEEQVFFATVLIEILNPATRETALGTGFIVGYPVPSVPDESVLVLVTCRHVLQDDSGIVNLRFHVGASENADAPDLSKSYVVSSAKYADAFVAHPDAAVDVAAINISRTLKNEPLVYLKWLGQDNFADPGAVPELTPGASVFFIGYPTGFHDVAHNLPILRGGHVASLPHVDFDGKPEFLIDAHVYPGSSGSPVFCNSEGVWKCVGMIGKSVTRAAVLKSAEAGGAPHVVDFIGLGIVYKPAVILEVVQLAAEKAAERISTNRLTNDA